MIGSSRTKPIHCSCFPVGIRELQTQIPYGNDKKSKGNGKGNCKCRLPSGMTKKSKGDCNCERRLPLGMTNKGKTSTPEGNSSTTRNSLTGRRVRMKSTKQLLFLLLIVWMALACRTYAQTSELEKLFHDLESMDAGTQAPFDKADPVLERLIGSDRETVVRSLPVILHATSDPALTVRRVAAFALYEITMRPDGPALLSRETATFAALLTDPDIPVRRGSGSAIANLRLDATSPLVPILQSYLARQDAVITIGAGVATMLLKAAPNDADSTNAVVQYMRRKDQTSASRDVLLDAITNVARSHNRDIAKEVAAYADDSDENTSVHAINTLQFMGKDAILDSQQFLRRIAGDTTRTRSLRAAATKALSALL